MNDIEESREPATEFERGFKAGWDEAMNVARIVADRFSKAANDAAPKEFWTRGL